MSVDVAVAPETSWSLLRDPSSTGVWYSAYVRSHPVRDVRVRDRADGTKAQERFIGRDDGQFASHDYLEDQRARFDAHRSPYGVPAVRTRGLCPC